MGCPGTRPGALKDADLLFYMTGGKCSFLLKKLYVPGHIFYFTPKTVADLLENAGLEVINLKKSDTPAKALLENPFMIIIYEIVSVIQRMTDRCFELNLICRKKKLNR